MWYLHFKDADVDVVEAVRSLLFFFSLAVTNVRSVLMFVMFPFFVFSCGWLIFLFFSRIKFSVTPGTCNLGYLQNVDDRNYAIFKSTPSVELTIYITLTAQHFWLFWHRWYEMTLKLRESCWVGRLDDQRDIWWQEKEFFNLSAVKQNLILLSLWKWTI